LVNRLHFISYIQIVYKDFKITEVVDTDDTIHYAFEDELKPEEVKELERSYSEEEVIKLLHKRDEHMNTYDKLHGGFQTPKEWFKQFKKK
jgi:hypothetical protein